MDFSSVIGPGISAVVPLLQSRQQHDDQITQSNALHSEAIRQAQEHHNIEVEIGRQYHERDIKTAKDLHDDAKKTDYQLHREALAEERRLHLDAIDKSLAWHRESIDKAHQQHMENLTLSTRFHLESLKQEYEHHLQQLAHDTETSRRENLRDVWSQKNRKAETLLITTTLMFGCFFSVVVEGMPPEESWSWLVTVYALTLSLSFLFLFLCMWFTMRAMAIMTKFDLYNPQRVYKCGERHTTFESYYQCHVAAITRHADKCFYVGTMLLVVTAVILLISRFHFWFNNPAAATIFSLVSIGGIASLAYFHRHFPTQTRMPQSLFGGATTGLKRGKSEYQLRPGGVITTPTGKIDMRPSEHPEFYMPVEQLVRSHIDSCRIQTAGASVPMRPQQQPLGAEERKKKRQQQMRLRKKIGLGATDSERGGTTPGASEAHASAHGPRGETRDAADRVHPVSPSVIPGASSSPSSSSSSSSTASTAGAAVSFSSAARGRGARERRRRRAEDLGDSGDSVTNRSGSNAALQRGYSSDLPVPPLRAIPRSGAGAGSGYKSDSGVSVLGDRIGGSPVSLAGALNASASSHGVAGVSPVTSARLSSSRAAALDPEARRMAAESHALNLRAALAESTGHVEAVAALVGAHDGHAKRPLPHAAVPPRSSIVAAEAPLPATARSQVSSIRPADATGVSFDIAPLPEAGEDEGDKFVDEYVDDDSDGISWG